ncbi:sensor histidine kinase [Altibacter sp. HG106]|uniref:sensor histidine kinase n=1 Tax=Altibacter sp. HG106 TaxID=3023937 RepID=UPI002350AC1F|nr:histidine kinase [Altibacter sp. HG106]MDC7993895.1 histidine kinase [Altibacter sp. HG106]
MLAETIDTYVLLTFVAIGIMLALVFLFAVFLNKKNQLIKEKATLELEYQKRMFQTELKALRAQLNPHFVHNSLNAILYYVQQNDVDKSEKYLSTFSKLIRQYFEYSRKQEVTLAEEADLLQNYLDIEKLRFEEKLQYHIEIDPTLDDQELFLPSMLLQPLVENAVNHGVFHKKGLGKIKIQFTALKGKNGLKVTVSDDGIGMNASKKIYQQSNSSHRSNSSQVLQERLQLLKESNNWDITYKAIDLANASEENGTQVTLTIKPIPA